MSKVNFSDVRKAYSLCGFFENVIGAERTQLVEGMRYSACPNCGSASKKSVKVSVRNHKWHCFACGKGGDVIEAASQYYDVGLSKAADILASGLVPDDFVRPVAPPPKVIEKDYFSISEVVRLLQERKYIDFNVVDYLLSRKIPREIIVESVMNGTSIHLPSNPVDALKYLLEAVGKDLLIKSGMWKEKSKVPGIIYRPLAFCDFKAKGIEFRQIAESTVSQSKSIRYGDPLPFKWNGVPRFGVMFVEGGVDMLTAVAMGSKRTIYAVPGALNFECDADWLQIGSRDVLLALDNDDAGRAGDAALRKILNPQGCRLATFDLRGHKDLNDLHRFGH